MTLWHLLHSFSFTVPLASAVFVGIKTGNTGGIVAALVLGLAISFGSFYGLHETGYNVYQRTEKMKSEVTQNLTIGLLYFGTLVWSFLAGAIAVSITRLVISYVAA